MYIRNIKKGTGVAAAVLLSALPALTEAQSIDNDRFVFRIGSYYLEDSDTEISIRGDRAPIGTTVDFVRGLGVEKSGFSTRASGYYRFNAHHRIDYEWNKIEREGARTIERDILLRDQLYPVNSGVNSSVHTTLANIAYTWSFHHTEDVELGASIGAYVVDYDIRINTRRNDLLTNESVTAPMPMFGLRLDYTINPRWHLLFDVETFYLEVESDTRGSMNDLQLALEYRPFDHVGVGLAASRMSMDLRLQDDYLWNVSDLYRGGEVYLRIAF